MKGNNPSIDLRPLTVYDAPILAAIHETCFERGWSKDVFFNLLGLPTTKGWLAFLPRFHAPNLHKDDLEAFSPAKRDKSRWSSQSTSRNLSLFAGEKDQNGFVRVRYTKPSQPIGFILASILPPEAEILTFAVCPSWQRQQVGKKLISHFITACHPCVTTVFLEVDALNKAALALYKRQGFQKIGVRPHYYTHSSTPPTDAYIMQLELTAE